MSLGSFRGATRRWWLDPTTFQNMRLPVQYHNTRRGMGLMSARITAVERIYQLAQELDLLRPDLEFNWHWGRSYDAAAGRPGDWCALFWSGIWEDQAAIRRRLLRLGPELIHAWPRLLAFAVPDHWQAFLVRRTLDEFHLTEHAVILVAEDDSWALRPAPHPPRPSDGWPDPPRTYAPPRPDSGREFIQALEQQRYHQNVGSAIQRILTVLEQWPGSLPLHIHNLLRRRVSRTLINKALDEMQALDLSTARDRAHFPGQQTWVRAAHRDRVNHKRTASRLSPSNPDQMHESRRTHNWGAAKTAAAFLLQGASIAPGWRAVDDAGDAGKIDPDAVMMLSSGPYGPGWHYLEWERRATTPAMIYHKLRGYRMPERNDTFPVIFVVPNERIQRIYWEQGQGINLITAVAQGHAPPTQWHCFGTAVRLHLKPS